MFGKWFKKEYPVSAESILKGHVVAANSPGTNEELIESREKEEIKEQIRDQLFKAYDCLRQMKENSTLPSEVITAYEEILHEIDGRLELKNERISINNLQDDLKVVSEFIRNNDMQIKD